MIKRRDFLVGSAAVAGSALVGFGAGTSLAAAVTPPVIQDYQCIVFKDLPLAPYGNGIPAVTCDIMNQLDTQGSFTHMRVHPNTVYSEEIREHYSIWDTGDIIERTFTYTGTFVVAIGLGHIYNMRLNDSDAFIHHENYYVHSLAPLSAVVEGIRA